MLIEIVMGTSHHPLRDKDRIGRVGRQEGPIAQEIHEARIPLGILIHQAIGARIKKSVASPARGRDAMHDVAHHLVKA